MLDVMLICIRWSLDMREATRELGRLRRDDYRDLVSSGRIVLGLTPRPFRLRKNRTPSPSPLAPSEGSTHWHILALVHRDLRKPSDPPSTLLR